MAYLGQPLTQQDIYSPPAYYDRMVYDPSQPPVQMGWGSGGWGPYGPWPGYHLGQRIITQAEADRIAKERKDFMEKRAEISEDPAHRYISPEGRFRPKIAAALQAEHASRHKSRKITKDPVKQLQKRIFMTVLLGIIISAILK